MTGRITALDQTSNLPSESIEIGPITLTEDLTLIRVDMPLTTKGALHGGLDTLALASLIEVLNTDVHFEWDCTGGDSAGLDELVSAIRRHREKGFRVTSYIRGHCTSAAYWIASQSDEIVASPLAVIGSIGCQYVRSSDNSEHGELLVVTSSNAPYKNGTDDIEQYQRLVDEMEAVFISSVAEGRHVIENVVRETYGRGAVLPASEALQRGMIDSIREIYKGGLDMPENVKKPEDEAPVSAPEAPAEEPEAPVEEPKEEEKPDAPVDGVVVAEDMVPAEEYGKLKGEYDALKGELELLKKEIEAMKAPVQPEEMPKEEPKPEEDPAVTEAKAQLVAIKAELAEVSKRASIKAMIADGRISASEEGRALAAFEDKRDNGWWKTEFADRKPGHRVPLNRVSSSEKSVNVKNEDLNKRVVAYVKENKLDLKRDYLKALEAVIGGK